MTDQSGYLLMHAAIRGELDRLAELAVGLAAGSAGRGRASSPPCAPTSVT
ncbi:hypothetical protein [Dactylosporangium cerinum]